MGLGFFSGGIGAGSGFFAAGIGAGSGFFAAGIGAGSGFFAAGIGAGSGFFAAGIGAGSGFFAAGIGAGSGFFAAGIGAGSGLAGAGLVPVASTSGSAETFVSASSFLDSSAGEAGFWELLEGLDPEEPPPQPPSRNEKVTTMAHSKFFTKNSSTDALVVGRTLPCWTQRVNSSTQKRNPIHYLTVTIPPPFDAQVNVYVSAKTGG